MDGTLSNANKYTLNTWEPATFGAQGAVTYLTLAGNTEQDIRPPASAAFGLASAIFTGQYDAVETGVSEASALATAERLIISLAKDHKANGGNWGYRWQSALWAALAGHAAWLVWGDLSETDQQYVSNMVGREADYLLRLPIEFWKDGAGNFLRAASDSAAEDASWNSMLMHLAAAMMPGHDNAVDWVEHGVRLNVAAFSQPSDYSDTDTEVNGRSVAEWINGGGSNAQADGTVINHGRIHPDYMISSLNLAAACMYALTGTDTPTGVTFATDRQWAAMTTLSFTDPPYDAPGGTIYQSGDIYYPEGTDLGEDKREDKAAFDIAVLTTTDATGAESWAVDHVGYIATLQARDTTGQTYQDSAENTYSGREQMVAWCLGWARLALSLDANNAIEFSDAAPSAWAP